MKKLFLAIAALLLVLIVAALAAPYFISADALKKPLIAKIEAATGRHVTVDGKFQLRFFPIAGISMEGVTLTNPPSYGDAKPLMTLKSLDVDVAVIPLLSGNIEVKKLILDEPQLNLHVSKDGVKNWLPPQSAPQSTSNAPAVSASSSSLPLPRNLMLNDVKMENGAVAYDDEAVKQQWNVQKINATLSLDGVASPFTVDASSEWNGKKISIKGTLATLQSFLNQARTKIDANIESDLLSLKIGGAVEKSVYTGKTEVKSSSLKSLLAWISPSAAPISAQGALALNLNSDMACSASNCSITNADLTLDNIKAKGSIKADWEKKPQVDVDLVTGVLDFNPFMSQHADASGVLLLSDAYAETDGRWSDKPLDLSALQSVNGTANIVADGIVANKVTLGKTTLRAKLDNGRLDADVIDTVMYGGKGNMTLNVDAATSPPTLEKHASLKGIQIQPLLKDAADLNRLSGTADIDMTVSGRGRNEKELVESLTGKGEFTLNNGSIEGVDITSLAFNKSGGAQKTPITDMKGSFTIAQGIVSNKDLVMTLPTVHIGGQGDINLPAYTINYRLTPQVVEAADNKGGAAKTGVGVPVVVEGSLEKPNIHPDLNALAQDALKNPQQFKQQLKNTRDTLKDQLKNPNAVNNLKNLLNGL